MPVDTYDISVENTENFAINAGFVSHNSSEIAIGPVDPEFINLKNYNLYPERAAYGWCSNNSVYGTIGMDYDEIAKRVADNGEPGIFWLKTAQDYSRLCDAPDYKDRAVVGTNPCGEQSLCNYELCCLCEVYINNHKTIEDFLRTLKFAYLYAKTVTLGDTHWVETNRVLLRNRRIGCSLTGIAQFLVGHNLEDLRVWCDTGYKTIQRYDGIYSDYLAIPRSIKTTSIKPSGCVTMGTEIIVGSGVGQKKMTMHEIFRSCGVDLESCMLDNISGMWIAPTKKFMVRGVDGQMHEITNLFVNGNAECVEIPLIDGTVITCTHDHKLYVLRDGEYQWIRAGDIVETDSIATC